MPDVNTNRVTQTIPLDLQTPAYSDLVFLSAEINARQYTSFALIRYMISGHERSRSLRLDLGKRRFIDAGDAEPNNPEFEVAARKLAPLISERVSMEMIKFFTSNGGTFFL